jgi:hypothetical protein
MSKVRVDPVGVVGTLAARLEVGRVSFPQSVPLSFRSRTAMRLVRPYQTVAQWKWKPTWGCHARFAASCSTPRIAPCCCSAYAHRPRQFTTASIESLVSHSATAAGKKSMPIGADAKGTQTPWSTAECRVQGEEPAALGVGSAVVIHVAGQPPSAPPVEIELLLVGWSASLPACRLSVYLSTKHLPCNSRA